MISPRSLLVLLAAVALAKPAASGQGPIVPTGTPGPTMKTLDQVEARIPIPGGTTNFYSGTSGSYYLTGDLVVSTGTAIDIRGNNVTIDLNGYSVSSALNTSPSNGIYAGGNVTIRNGSIRGATTYPGTGTTYSPGGFAYGIYLPGSNNAIRIEHVTISGVSSYGIYVEGSFPTTTDISHCQVLVSAGTGIKASGAGSIDHCTALYCANAAIDGNYAVSDCYGYSTGSDNGVSGKNVSNSFGVSNNGTALFAFYQVTNSYGEAYGASGGGLATNGVAVGCQGYASGNGTGLTAKTASHCVGISSGTGAFAGLIADEASDCDGTANGSGAGVKCAYTALNCRGKSNSGVGVLAVTATNCTGTSTSGNGLVSTTATNSTGTSTSGSGLIATTANTCVGSTGGTLNTSYGIDCGAAGLGIATGCRASVTSSSAVAVALRAFIGNSCIVSGGTISIDHKYDMP